MRLERLTNDFEAFAALARENVAAMAKRGLQGLRDEMYFFGGWTSMPLTTGAITPSGRPLADAMARQIDPTVAGPVIELGPGTGVITRALLDHGVDESRLILIEANEDFARLLRQRFPRAQVVSGDAFSLPALVSGLLSAPPAAVVSGLPLFNQPLQRRLLLLESALELLHPLGMFVQFSYHVLPPVSPRHGAFLVQGTKRVWRNIFPARVWVYRRPTH